MATGVFAQQENSVPDRCGTVDRLKIAFQSNPSLKVRFEQERAEFNQLIESGALSLDNQRNANQSNSQRTVLTIPVVFHIVLPNPDLVTNAQVLAQLDTLNKDFFGSNADSVKIPTYFKNLFGKSSIQFCLAQQTPDGQLTTGIDRVVTRQATFSNTSEAVKYASTGGADSWDNTRYLNIWVCTLSNGVVGYASFPEVGVPREEGVVIDYRAMPGGAFSQYNGGRTLTHETGHFFNLYHIWGDDDGACNGSDFVGDTPNQAGATIGCFTGIRNDNCTSSGTGVMYQNFMDYSNDNCMALFTTGQASRMEAAALLYRNALLNSNACLAPIVRNYDAQLRSISRPAERLCTNSFIPVINVQNRGVQTITSITVQSSIDGNVVSSYLWTGTLARQATANISLPALIAPTGYHTLKIDLLLPGSNPDEDASNNSSALTFHYFEPVASFSESFEGNQFPPASWDLVNPDLSTGWKRVTGIAKSGNNSVVLDNFTLPANGQKDDLRLPNISLPVADSAFLSFEVAAAAYTSLNTVNNAWDTLEVLVSTDCGETYTSVYKKFGSSLVTRNAAVQTAFVPLGSEWRKDSVNLARYMGAGTIVVAFRNTSGNENNVYLDDINLRTVTINPNLKAQGFLISPNPARNSIAIQFYPQPANLRAIQLFNMAGQKIAEIITNGQANNYYNFDISRFQSGTYVVRAVFSDRVIVRKVVKY